MKHIVFIPYQVETIQLIVLTVGYSNYVYVTFYVFETVNSMIYPSWSGVTFLIHVGTKTYYFDLHVQTSVLKDQETGPNYNTVTGKDDTSVFPVTVS